MCSPIKKWLAHQEPGMVTNVRALDMHAGTVNGLTVVTLAGELDLAAAPALRLALCRAPDAALPDLAVDLSRVEFMDCAVVGVLIAALNTVKAQGGCLRLHGLKGEPMRLMELCRLDGVIWRPVRQATVGGRGLKNSRRSPKRT